MKLRSLNPDPLDAKGVRPIPLPGDSVKGQVRGSNSARLREVRGGSRRMRPPKFLPTSRGGGAHVQPLSHPAPMSVQFALPPSKWSSATTPDKGRGQDDDRIRRDRRRLP